jgi:glycerophosphoryl diester phosphodiesterase
MKKILFIFLLITVFCYGNAQENNSNKPLIIAHRGDSYHAPENTLASAKLGWEHGADAVEIDIYLSSDNRIMVIHDSNTQRTSGKNYKVAETLSDTLRKLDVGKWKDMHFTDEKIPFLEEIIQAIPKNKKLVIEIKCGVEILPFLQQVFKHTKKMDQCIIISFRFNVVTEAKKTFPSIPVYFLADKLTSGEMEELAGKMKSLNIDGLNMRYSGITPDVIRSCTQYKIDLYAWTVDNPDDARSLIKAGIKGITSNKPLELKECLELK